MHQRKLPSRRSQQRGVVAIIVGLSMFALVGFAGLALDGGRLYVNKTELQNAADGCALAASFELTGAPNIPRANFPIAESAGRLVAGRNRVGFQAAGINATAGGDVTVEFGTALSGGAWVGAGAATGASKYVRCTIQETGITPWFMQVLGFGDATVRSGATASLVPSQQACNAIPLGLCANGSAPTYGLVAGQWYNGGFNNSGQLTGSFNWVDFTPPGGGANEASGILEGGGVCLSNVGTNVGQPGAIQSLRRAWNTRFGVYSPNYNPNDVNAPKPDRAGYAYRPQNWPSQTNALANFLDIRRPANTPYGTPGAQNGNTITGLQVQNNNTVLQSPALATRGTNRRIVSAPILNCPALRASQTVPILDYACVLMLHPMDNDPSLTIYMEYIGLSNAPGGPCASSGIPGGPTSTGPFVPGLVQ